MRVALDHADDELVCLVVAGDCARQQELVEMSLEALVRDRAYGHKCLRYAVQVRRHRAREAVDHGALRQKLVVVARREHVQHGLSKANGLRRQREARRAER